MNQKPLVTVQWKLRALAAMLVEEEGNKSGFSEASFEDAAWHLCDLLELCRLNIHPSIGRPFPDLLSMVNYYGRNLGPIDMNCHPLWFK